MGKSILMNCRFLLKVSQMHVYSAERCDVRQRKLFYYFDMTKQIFSLSVHEEKGYIFM